jgi:uncharacterized protein (DUF433 family)
MRSERPLTLAVHIPGVLSAAITAVVAYDRGMAFERITVNPERMGGKPCIRDLRVTVTMVLGQLAGGRSIEEVLADYPYLEREDLLAALEYAAAVVDQR